MALPTDVQAVIDAAREHERQELILADLRAQKQQHQDAIAALNPQITAQVSVVQAARANLKSLASAL